MVKSVLVADSTVGAAAENPFSRLSLVPVATGSSTSIMLVSEAALIIDGAVSIGKPSSLSLAAPPSRDAIPLTPSVWSSCSWRWCRAPSPLVLDGKISAARLRDDMIGVASSSEGKNFLLSLLMSSSEGCCCCCCMNCSWLLSELLDGELKEEFWLLLLLLFENAGDGSCAMMGSCCFFQPKSGGNETAAEKIHTNAIINAPLRGVRFFK